MLKRQKKATEPATGGSPATRRRTKAPAVPKTYGMVAEFNNEEDLIAAAHHAHERGYRKMDAYTPYPIEEVSEAIGFHYNRVALVVLICGLSGLALGFLLQYYIMVIDYPLNFNGRAPFSWPAWVPAMFETTILLSAFGAVFGMLALNGLPLLYHPIFNAPGFERASKDGYFFCIEATDPNYDPSRVRQFYQEHGARNVAEINW